MTYLACEDPIFIIGTERSGSNMLRLMLNSHSEIAIPHPPHIMKYFADLEPRYGDLRVDGNFRALIRDVLALVAGHIHPWPALPSIDSLLAHAGRDLFALSAALHEHYLAVTGKKRWGCKSTFMIHHVSRVRARYPRAKFLWLVRDPRDVALSSRDSVFNPYHPYFTAALWRDQQSLGLELQRTAAAVVQRVYYERLVREPHAAIREICAFLDIRFEPGMLRYFESADARVASQLARDWVNVTQPIRPDKAQRYVRELCADHRRIVEAVAGPIMRQLGYELDLPLQPHYRAAPLRKLSYRIANEARRILVECRSLCHSRNHALRWKRAMRIACVSARVNLRVWRTLASQTASSGRGAPQDSRGAS